MAHLHAALASRSGISHQQTELSMRPIWHQRADSVQAHILVCFLALCLWKTLEGWQSRAGLGNSPRTLLEELKRIQTVDVVMPLVNGPELRLRCVLEPDQALATLLDRMSLRLPKRLRASPRWERKCSGKMNPPIGAEGPDKADSRG